MARGEKEAKYECIVLDLDGSLVCSRDKNYGTGEKITFTNVYGENETTWVHKRPGFDIFLKKCFELGNVGVWSMGQPGYVNAIVKLFPEQPIFVYNWRNCDREPGRIFKKLDAIPYNGSIVMIDDKTDTLEKSSRVDVIIIPEWHPKQKKDKTLYQLIEVLQT